VQSYYRGSIQRKCPNKETKIKKNTRKLMKAQCIQELQTVCSRNNSGSSA